MLYFEHGNRALLNLTVWGICVNSELAGDVFLPKVGRTNFDGVLHHSACVRKEKTLKSYVLSCALNTNTVFLIQSTLGNLTSVAIVYINNYDLYHMN